MQLDKKEKYLFIETFGCQMNDNDSEKIIGLMSSLNCKTTDSPDKADIVILNTCSIRGKAEQKVYSALGRFKKLKKQRPDLIIGVGGCVAQQEGNRLLKRAPHLDVVFGTHNIHRLPDLIKEVESTRSRVAATDFFSFIEDEELFEYTYAKNGLENPIYMVKVSITIMRGCNNFCSYCIVPYVRGREMSRKSSDILQEAKKLIKAEVKEITLLGQNVNSYGNNGADISFPELLRLVCRLDGIERVRFITSHPKDMSEELIQLFGEEERLCRHIHLPLQSGSDTILKIMNRGYTREDYLNKILKLKMLYPGMAITTDIIVGFPGETESDFLDTMNLIKEIEFDNIFSFKYSPRQETMAASFDSQISDTVKEERLAILQETQMDITHSKNQEMLGKTVDVLIEGKSKTADGGAAILNNAKRNNAVNAITQLTGRTSCNKVVNLSASEEFMGRIAPVRIIKASPNSLTGSIWK
ncbi:MAG: tRNA (N6-isopentenyl adenosine(37)-C2)-methylthiotransferase MiaB [Deltaproteobacteria bacterium]|nr:tRNA (N6-isopentenyl adenosine(37)-C2)-methylthiotransferase MiaB [Deltaproteobacteria bacterium]